MCIEHIVQPLMYKLTRYNIYEYIFCRLYLLSQVFYPMLMFAMICRTIIVRVRPDDLITFESSGLVGNVDDDQRSFFSRVKTGLKESGSLFAWADKGQWATTERARQDARQEGDSFRIGFEPIFVDFTKEGSWFMAFALVQVRKLNTTPSNWCHACRCIGLCPPSALV